MYFWYCVIHTGTGEGLHRGGAGILICGFEYFLECFEPSALEDLVRGFISSPLSSLILLSSVDWPSWRGERHGGRFPRIPVWTRCCLWHSCINSCFHLFVLGSTRRLYFCPDSSEERLLQLFVLRQTYADVGACLAVNGLVLSFIFLIDIYVFFEHVPRRLPSVATTTGWYRCAFPWAICIILCNSHTAMFSYCITVCLCCGYALLYLCLADKLAIITNTIYRLYFHVTIL
jgi:hypothetical protein